MKKECKYFNVDIFLGIPGICLISGIHKNKLTLKYVLFSLANLISLISFLHSKLKHIVACHKIFAAFLCLYIDEKQ